MNWCPVCVLCALICVYVGGSVAVIYVIVSHANITDPGMIFVIVFFSVLISISVCGMIYYLVKGCITIMYGEERAITPVTQHPPQRPIPIVSKQGTIIEQPNGDIELGIKNDTHSPTNHGPDHPLPQTPASI